MKKKKKAKAMSKDLSPLGHALALANGWGHLSHIGGERILEHMSAMLGLYGVESITNLKGEAGPLYYINRGDTYAQTLTFRPLRSPQFALEAWGDVVEKEGQADE